MLRKGGIGSRPTDDQQPQSSPSLGAEGSQWATPAYMDTRSQSSEHYTASSDDLTGIDHAHSQPPPSAAQPTIIQLDDVAAGEDGVASMTGDTTGIRSRSAPANEVPQLTPPRARRDTGRSKSSSQEEDDFDPVEEFLGVLPPPLARFLVFLGTKLNPAGLQLIAVKKDLKEEPKADIYNTNKTQHIVKALTTGLKPYGLALAIAAVVWILTTFISPSFFVYPYLHLDPSGIFSSWPLFLGEGVLASAVWYFRGRDVRTQGRPFFLKAANSLLLATVEELGFRFLFVCFAMVATGLFNVFIEQVGIYLGALMMVAGVVVMIIAALYLMGVLKQNEHVRRIMKRYNPVHVVVGSGILIVAGLCVLVMGLVWNALFAILWDWLIFPVVNFLTFYQYDQLFMGAFGMNFNSYEGAWAGSRRRRKIWQQNATDNRMFMVGILLANVFYRDGKKYQGVLGWLNSWYVGLALANAMLTHGLFTALAVHLLYDAQFFVVGYIVNKYFAKRRPSLDDL